MGRNKRAVYVPQQRGWIVARDMLGTVLWHADCSRGGAQEELQKQFDRLLSEGWQLEGRSFDFQFANRQGERVLVGIYPRDPAMTRKPGAQ